ncbi:MAG: hypothetical protein K9M54_11330 [Kiritimatiellales bacterium]|nr:hypothetical protein [Kiritimatiellales bacterium]MCF7864569.1 hypothetical protein [Kiritimatiellales bacterium]
MQDFFGLDYYGKNSIASRYGICDSCRKLTALNSYTTGQFFHFRQFPLIPLGKKHIVDECPHCGHRVITSNRSYQKHRTNDLAAMMEGFTSESDNPDTALNGLHTLMVYNEESWFMDVMNSYGRRFYSHMQLQLVIAQGLCRFGHYEEAETYCRKAIVLGAGPRAEELLALCQSLREKGDKQQMEVLCAQPEAMVRPYAFIIAVSACVCIALLATGISAMRNHTAWLVSGFSKPYLVEIDGSQYRMNPYGVKRITLRLGKHLLQTHGLPGHDAPVSFSYTTSLIKQKFRNYALVLNPDSLAVVTTETMYNGQTTNDYIFGETVNAMTGINHPFSSFPVWARSGHSPQTRLSHLTPKSHLEVVELLNAQGKTNDASAYVRRALIIEPASPETKDLLAIAIDGLPIKNTLAFLKRGRDTEPPLIEWHEFYQNFMDARQPDYDLQTEYALLCEAHPNTPEYFYLLARVARNHADAQILFGKSEQGQGSNGFGYNAIAYDLLCSGEFAAALPYSEKALEKSPDNPTFKSINTQIHLAMEDYAPLLQECRTAIADDPQNGRVAAKIVRYLTLLGEHQQASDFIATFQPPEAGESILWGDLFNAERFHAVGNATDYIDSLVASGSTDAELQHLLFDGNIEQAQPLLNQNENHPYTDHLILYCAARYHGFTDIADTQLAKAVAEIGTSSRTQRETAAFLLAETAPGIKPLLELRILPQEKAILCTALGFRFPEQRDALFALSRKFNFTPEYPQLLLKKWIRPPRNAQ